MKGYDETNEGERDESSKRSKEQFHRGFYEWFRSMIMFLGNDFHLAPLWCPVWLVQIVRPPCPIE